MEKGTEGLSAHGSFVGTLIRADGTVEVFRKDNLILNSGIDAICGCFSSDGQAEPLEYIAVGTGTSEVTATQTSLVSELTRKKATYTHVAGTSFLTLEVTFNKGEATGAITEAGICNTEGVFFDRVVRPVINKGEDDIYTVTFKITFIRA